MAPSSSSPPPFPLAVRLLRLGHVQLAHLAPFVPRYALRPRRHQHEDRVAVREGPDDPRPPPVLAVDAFDPVVRPDPAPVLRREFRVGKRLGEPVAHLPLVALCPDELGRHLVERCVERPLVDRYDVRRHGSRSLCR